MILFRLLSFSFRIIGSFFFVFFLQIQFDGKTLESYLNNFGKKFFVTKNLQKISQDSVKVIRSFSSSKDNKKVEKRKTSSSQAIQYIKDFSYRITIPEELGKKEKNKIIQNTKDFAHQIMPFTEEDSSK